jgi:RNA polymerase sigma-70 factor (ECF subfamily)
MNELLLYHLDCLKRLSVEETAQMANPNLMRPEGKNHIVGRFRQRSYIDPEQLVDQHADTLYRFALLRTGNTVTAEELVQETFLAALQTREKFRGDSSERTWLIGILKHKIVDHFRKLKHEICSGDLSEQFSEKENPFNEKGRWKEPPIQWSETPENTLECKEFWEVMTNCLNKLSLPMRRVFSLREFDEVESEEICNILDISLSNLYVLMYRSRHQLRRCLEKHWFISVKKEKDSNA